MRKNSAATKISRREVTPPWRATKTVVRVVLPAYNEAPNLGPLLERIDEAMFETGYEYEIFVIDDGSKDETCAVVERYLSQVPLRLHRHSVNQGLGATIRDGLELAAKASEDKDIIIAMDADNTHTPQLMLSMIRGIKEGSDVVIASRYQSGSYVRGLSRTRSLMSFGASLLFRLVFPGQGIKDYTSGFRAYRASFLKTAFQKYGEDFVNQTGFQCMVDILLKLRSMGAIMREVPLILRYDQKEGRSKMRVFSTILSTLTLLVRRRLGIRS